MLIWSNLARTSMSGPCSPLQSFAGPGISSKRPDEVEWWISQRLCIRYLCRGSLDAKKIESGLNDLLSYNLTFVECRSEIGHVILEDQLHVPATRLKVLDTGNVADISDIVASSSADIAITDGLSCAHGLAARGAEGPKLKIVLRRRPLYLCFNGVMIGKNQKALSEWLDQGLKTVLAEPEFAKAEESILEEYHGIIAKL